MKIERFGSELHATAAIVKDRQLSDHLFMCTVPDGPALAMPLCCSCCADCCSNFVALASDGSLTGAQRL